MNIMLYATPRTLHRWNSVCRQTKQCLYTGCKKFQVYFGVSTLLDATSSDSLKAEDEQKEVILLRLLQHPSYRYSQLNFGVFHFVILYILMS